MVPEGWVAGQVSDICRLQNGRGFKPEDWGAEGLPIIRIQNLNGSKNFNYYSGKPEEKWLVEPGQMLFAWAGTKGVSFGPTVWRGETGVLNQHIFKVFQQDGVDHDWLYLALRHVTDRVEGKAHGFKATLVHVKKSDIERQPVAIPPLPEQKKIAEILSTWDRAIETAEALLANARTQKRALMQTLLTGKRRFPQFEGQDWREVRFEEVFGRVRRKNTVGNENTLTISGQDGLVSQQEYFNKRVAAADLSGYTLLVGGDFAYNKSYSAGYPMGAIKMLPDGQSGVVSSLYLCFALGDPDAHCKEFFRHFFEAGCFNHEIYKIAQEGARNHGLLNVSVTDFFRAKIRIPSREEQRRIADAINLAEREEARDLAVLEKLRTEKKALMQQLLTGKKRVRL
ncbi:restriction endonuclease subunit S [Thioclava electrotropha]|uniref:Restriction endonuclease subunit S n=1 Tax=Thioclava electrotropha TaxID=1549850 RepID=A0ABX6YTV9_9RHOB|nr:restriction endonuclease subunit S [Thioclava electrotropha]QPZ91205.1 restriction endonuclease subunit S [Thioclava electrotropha]